MNMDILVTVPRLPGPGATVLGSAARFAPGGKGGNQAVAAARLGARARMVGCVGDDDFGARLTGALRAESVDTSAVRLVPEMASGLALITVDPDGENMITVASGANQAVGDAEVSAALAALAAPGGVLVISAEIPVPAIAAALARAAAGRVTCVLNLAPAPAPAAAVRLLSGGVDWLVLNEPEAATVLGHPVAGLAGARPAAAALAQAGARHAVVTAGAQGAAFAGPDGAGAVPAFPVRVVDSVGAGDTFVGALAMAVGADVPPPEAVRAACAAAAVTAASPGTQDAMPHPADVLALTGVRWPPSKS
jgi:ribokinase